MKTKEELRKEFLSKQEGILAEACKKHADLAFLYEKDRKELKRFFDHFEATALFKEQEALIYLDSYKRLKALRKEYEIQEKEDELAAYYMRRRYALLLQQEEEEEGSYEHDLEELAEEALIILLILCVDNIIAHLNNQQIVKYERARIDRIKQRLLTEEEGAKKPPSVASFLKPKPPRP